MNSCYFKKFVYFIISEQLHYQYLLEKLCMYINLVAERKKKISSFFLLGVWEIIYENKRDDEIRKKNKIICSFIDGKI